MQNNNYLSKEKTQALIDGLAIKKEEGKAFLDGLVAKGYTIQGYNDQPKPEEKGLLNDLSKRGSNMLEIAKNTKINPLSRGTQGLGQMAGAVGDVVGAGVGAVAGAIDDVTGNVISDAGKSILQTTVGQEGLKLAQENAEGYAAWKQKNPEAAGNLEAVVNIATLLPLGKASSIAKNAAVKTAETLPKAGEVISSGAKSITDGLLSRVTPKPVTPTRAIGQIAQGATEDIKPVAKALSIIDTSKVKTFDDLLGKVDSTIPTLAKQVDDELLKDTGVYTLGDLALSQKTKAGKEIKTDFVSRALDNLNELYKTTGDDVAKADLEEIISKATSQGLTRKEVNDISRIYGQEFGRKAFSKMGDPLTSVNAQAFENIRTGLKQVARQGIGGAEAKNIDSQLSALYDTQKLVEKNVEAVNKLKQKIQDRGLLENLTHNAFKALDLLSAGTIRGVVGGLLPRGAGYKTMNALDIEDALRGNLDVVEKALKTNSDDELMKLINQSFQKSDLPNSSLIKNTTKSKKAIVSKVNMKGTVPQVKKNATPDNFPRDKTLTGENATIQEKSIEKYLDNKETLTQDYLKTNGKVVNTDEARKFFKDVGYKGSNAAAVQEASSAVAKDAWKNLLTKSKGKDVLIYAGGSGTGKTSAVKNILPNEIKDASAILDGNLSSIKSAEARIQEALDAGANPHIVYVYRTPEESWTEGVIKRMLENKEEGGRLVPMSVFLENHKGSYDVVNNLRKAGIDVQMVDNSLGKGKQSLLSPEKFASIKYDSTTKNKLLEVTKSLYEQGKITKEQYEALIK